MRMVSIALSKTKRTTHHFLTKLSLVTSLEYILEQSEAVPDSYVGSYEATDGEGNPVHISISADDSSYKFCNQDIGDARHFPPVLFATPAIQPEGGEWMSDEQDQFAYVFGTVSFGIMMMALLSHPVLQCQQTPSQHDDMGRSRRSRLQGTLCLV